MKELIKWSDIYKLGVEEIDPQHQRLVGIINRFYQVMQESNENKEMKKIFMELTDYAEYHFSTEERHFEEFNYIDKVEHTRSHEEYKAKIAQFVKDFESGVSSALPFQLMDFLGEWWTGHILGEDRKYVECFHEHGLK